jgi:hypothetical protein
MAYPNVCLDNIIRKGSLEARLSKLQVVLLVHNTSMEDMRMKVCSMHELLPSYICGATASWYLILAN